MTENEILIPLIYNTKEEYFDDIKLSKIEEKEWIMTGWKQPIPRKPNTKRLFKQVINRTRNNL